ncbi:hypothetical protein [Roseibium sp. Sym1]|uniref:hypothetical protein n=1 Tax=Roseibium sp. Sym1 TaxID=3016006 RepID=UPI0022B46CAD|nr:hypothetical protein [Roseibium sp. Sym1]
MKAATSFYFKKMSELDLDGFRYSDCFIEKPDQQYLKMGIVKGGKCILNTVEKNIILEVTMSSTARVISFDLEENLNGR